MNIRDVCAVEMLYSNMRKFCLVGWLFVWLIGWLAGWLVAQQSQK
jgi:hypothetical protein